MFLSRNKKNNVYPFKPSFTIQKWSLRGSTLYRYVFAMFFFVCVCVLGGFVSKLLYSPRTSDVYWVREMHWVTNTPCTIQYNIKAIKLKEQYHEMFILEFYGPVNIVKVMSSQSIKDMRPSWDSNLRLWICNQIRIQVRYGARHSLHCIWSAMW